MIAYLSGNVIFSGKNFVILETQGVGYKVFLSEKTLSSLSKKDERLKIYTHLHLREEKLELYGFLTAQELELFELLNDISGIGPRTALTLSSFGSIQKFKEAIDAKGEEILRGFKGLGTKKMQKIILEVTGRLKEIGAKPKASSVQKKDEVVEALVSLGISKQEAKSALAHVPKDILDANQRIREALRILGRR